jgi:hypothetical protein
VRPVATSNIALLRLQNIPLIPREVRVE